MSIIAVVGVPQESQPRPNAAVFCDCFAPYHHVQFSAGDVWLGTGPIDVSTKLPHQKTGFLKVPPKAMIRIIYFSTATAELTKPEVEELVSHAAASNAAKNVTGALAYNGRNFCQCLEGDEIVVRELIEAISRDTRHAGFRILDEKQISTRHFPEWSMHLIDGLDFSVVINAMTA